MVMLIEASMIHSVAAANHRVGAVGHGDQGQRGQDRADQEIGPAAAQRRPGLVAEMADDRLDQQARQGRGDPQDGQAVDLGAQGLEDAAGVGVLQAEADLDAEEADAHVHDRQRRQARADGQRASLGMAIISGAASQRHEADRLTAAGGQLQGQGLGRGDLALFDDDVGAAAPSPSRQSASGPSR